MPQAKTEKRVSIAEENASRLPRDLRIAVVHRSGQADWSWVLRRIRYANQLDIHSVRIPPHWADRGALQTPASLLAAERLWRTHGKQPFDLILSHLPGCAAWIETMRRGRQGRHDLFAFNFTALPSGARRTQMKRAVKRLHQAFTLTDVERSLYAEAFGIERERMSVVPWGIAPPEPRSGRVIEGRYIASLGGEARDYAPLMEAARLLPDERFVIVARPKNLEGLDVPTNVETLCNIPPADAWNVVAHADMHVLSLKSTETPCGIVTLVGAMHLGTPQIATAAAGVLEYAPDEDAALAVPEGSGEALAEAVRRFRADPQLADRLSASAKSRAAERFSEEMTMRFAEDYLRTIAEDPWGRVAAP